MNTKRIRSALAASCLLLLCACVLPSTREGEQADATDREAIEIAYQNWYTAWETKDHELAARDYSDDAIWVNAFGMRCVGRREIEKTLQSVFSMDFVMAGKSRTVEKTIRFLGPRVALVTSRIERGGQQLPSGAAMPMRQTSHLRVFAKSCGRWQIVSHLISDARDRERSGH